MTSAKRSVERSNFGIEARILGVFAACCLAGCGVSSVTRGADLYAGGQYVEAAEVFEHTEGQLAQYELEERARYGLYRGAALLSLGDVARANRWLAYSERVLARDRDALSDEERVMLTRAQAVVATRPETISGEPPRRLASSQAPTIERPEARVTKASY